MALSKYIYELLFRYECVIVPKFGGFLTKSVSAKIDENTTILHPPFKKLSFNAQLVENDGLLANYICAVDKVPYDAALNFIDFEVKEWKQKLINENITLEGLGTFSLSNEQNIQFEPNDTTSFLTEAFGLTSLIAPEIARTEIMREEVVFDLIKGDISDKDVFLNTDYRRKGITPYLKYAALIILLLGITAFLFHWISINNVELRQVAELQANQEELTNKRIQEATFEINKTLPAITLKITKKVVNEEVDTEENNVETETSAEISNLETTSNTKEKLTADTSKEEEKTLEEEDNKPIKNTEINTTSLGFHIIGGAFKDPENASKKVTELNEKGYNASIVGVNKWNLTQVAFGSFATKEEAEAFLRKIKKTEAKDAWLLID